MRKLGKITKKTKYTVKTFAACYCDCDCDCFEVSGSFDTSTKTKDRKGSWRLVTYNTNNNKN